jgi:hypothetical protein
MEPQVASGFKVPKAVDELTALKTQIFRPYLQAIDEAFENGWILHWRKDSSHPHIWVWYVASKCCYTPFMISNYFPHLTFILFEISEL